MRNRLRRRLGVEVVLGIVSLALSILTQVNGEWIEELTGFEPDGGSGLLEWAITFGFAGLALALGTLAWRDRRQLRQLASA